MMPQQIPFYSPALASGAPPVYGQPGFFPSNSAPQAQGLAVQVGVPVFGSAAQQAFVHVGNAGVGNVPFSSSNQQTHFIQGQQNNFVQGVRPNNGFAAPPKANLPGQWQGQPGQPHSPPPSSFPPGFEPGHNNNFDMGGPVVHNQHQVHYQHQHQHVNQHEYRHQHQQQHHQPHPQHQYQHQIQQHHQHQPQPQHQNQHLSQHQHQLQHEHQHQHQHQLQQQDHYQNQHPHAHSQLQMQAQQYQNPHPHSLPQLQLQTQSHPAQLQAWSQPQLQLQTQPQPAQLQTWPQQAQPACQQVQLIPAPFSNSLHVYPPNIQAGSENGVAIGLPVMSTPSHVGNNASQTVAQIQQPAQAWQPGYPENSLLSQCGPQPSNSNFAFTNNVHDNRPQVVAAKKDHHSNGWQRTNIQRNDCSNIERQTDPSQEHAQMMPSREHAQMMPPVNKPDSQFCVEGTKPSGAKTIGQNGHLGSGANHPSPFIENNHQHWRSPSKSQMPAWANGRNPHVSRGLQPHTNGQVKLPFSADAEKCGNGQHISQLQRRCDSRGKNFNKDVQKRSDMQLIRCDPCDRTFASSEIMAVHLKTHVKCGEEGCTFEAAGKIVKEHKVTEHGKVDIQATYRGRKALALRSMEDKEDIKHWREERKKSYPTSANILRKAEDQKRIEAEGEFVDEEAEKRCQRIREVIAKQKQLGYQVPEIPSHYFHTRHDRRPKKMVREEMAIADAADGKTEFVEGRKLVGYKRNADDMETLHDTTTRVEDLKNDSRNMEPINDGNGYQRKGYARKGDQSKFTSWHERQKHHQNYDARMVRPRPPPTLLSKLLHNDIQKESSYLMQCCRFIVNNAFLQDCSPTSLKHFEWIVAAMPASVDGSSAEVKSEIGEVVPTFSNSEVCACGEESTTLLDSKDSVAEDTGFKPSLSNTTDFVAGRETENAPHAPATSPQKPGRKNQAQDLVHEEPPESNLGQPRDKKHAVKAESTVDSTTQNITCSTSLESNDSQSNHFDTDKGVGSVHTSVSSWKPTSTTNHVSYDDVEAGEVVSGHTESIVEDEEDISQYMNFDASGADSGCCYD